MTFRSAAYLEGIERGELRVKIADTVVFEAAFLLKRRYKQPKRAVGDALLPLLELPGKRRLRRVFDMYVERNIPFADAYHAAIALNLGSGEIVSFDRDFDRVPGVRRTEP